MVQHAADIAELPAIAGPACRIRAPLGELLIGGAADIEELPTSLVLVGVDRDRRTVRRPLLARRRLIRKELGRSEAGSSDDGVVGTSGVALEQGLPIAADGD